jgi:hypothetical protein
VPLSTAQLEVLRNNPAAAMITVGSDGRPKVVRVGLTVVDGRLWSSGTRGRIRTRRLRADPRCTLYVQDTGYGYLALETTVTILDGPEAPADSLRLFRHMQGRPSGPLSWFGGELDENAFLEAMAREQRLIYQFDVEHSYGMA